MATIKTSCPMCGDVDLASSKVTLTICSFKAWSFYSFICPECRNRVEKPANDMVITLLSSGGVERATWHVPAEIFDPRPNGALTFDDLLDFSNQLAETDILTTLPGLTAP